LVSNEANTTARIFQQIRQELNSTRADFTQNIAERMAESLQNADTTASVLESMGNTLQEQMSEIQDKNQAITHQLYALENMTSLFIAELNASIIHSVNHTDSLFTRISSLMTAFSSQTAQQFTALSLELGNSYQALQFDMAKTNASLYAYVQLGLQNQSRSLSQKIDQQGDSLEQTISALGLNNKDGVEYEVPSKEVTNVVTAKAAAIDALDEPLLQSIRRYLDLVLSIKEIIVISIFVFNALILINGMSIIQSFQYTFVLPKRRELDKLRRVLSQFNVDFSRKLV